MEQNKDRIAIGTVYQISETKNKNLNSLKKSYKNAFVKFLDHNGNESEGCFLVLADPTRSAIRIGTQVEILYRENKSFGGYKVFLKDPLLYERIPSDQELVPYEKNTKMIRKQILLFFAAIFGTAILYGVLRALWPGGSFFSILLFLYLCFKITMMDSNHKHSDFMTWKRDDSMEWPE